MILTVFLLLVLCGLVLLIASVTSPPRAPLWIAVLFLYIIELLRLLPLGATH